MWFLEEINNMVINSKKCEIILVCLTWVFKSFAEIFLKWTLHWLIYEFLWLILLVNVVKIQRGDKILSLFNKVLKQNFLPFKFVRRLRFHHQFCFIYLISETFFWWSISHRTCLLPTWEGSMLLSHFKKKTYLILF